MPLGNPRSVVVGVAVVVVAVVWVVVAVVGTVVEVVGANGPTGYFGAVIPAKMLVGVLTGDTGWPVTVNGGNVVTPVVEVVRGAVTLTGGSVTGGVCVDVMPVNGVVVVAVGVVTGGALTVTGGNETAPPIAVPRPVPARLPRLDVVPKELGPPVNADPVA